MPTNELQACISWLRAEVTEFDGVFCLSPDYRENNPVYFGSDLEKIVELAIEDYADWDEGII